MMIRLLQIGSKHAFRQHAFRLHVVRQLMVLKTEYLSVHVCTYSNSMCRLVDMFGLVCTHTCDSACMYLSWVDKADPFFTPNKHCQEAKLRAVKTPFITLLSLAADETRNVGAFSIWQ